MSRPGFLFSQYIDILFPLSHSKHHSSQPTILDKMVHVDVMTAEKREFTAQGMMGGMSLGGIQRVGTIKRCSHPTGSGICSSCIPSRCAHAHGSRTCSMCTPCSHGMMPGSCVQCTDDKEISPDSRTHYHTHNHTHPPKEAKVVNGEVKKEKTTNGEVNGKKERPISWGMGGLMMGDSVAMARMSAKMAEGKTMKELSRLWQYQGGIRPRVAGEDLLGLRNGVHGMNGIRSEKLL
jgi:hypothetical protein